MNHLSDSVSIVDVGAAPPRVARTLLVGDEPRDIVFAGPGGNRAFITTAHRGQNRPGDPQLTTAGRRPRRRLGVRRDQPRRQRSAARRSRSSRSSATRRARSPSRPDGGTVYAAVFHSGNRRPTVSEGVVCDGGARRGPCTVSGATMPGGLPAPNANVQGIAAARGRPDRQVRRGDEPLAATSSAATGTTRVRFTLPDQDVFAIDANAGHARRRPATLRRRRHRPLQHGREPGEREGLRLATPRRATRCASRARATLRRHAPVRGHLARGAHHRARRRRASLPRHLNKHIDYSVRARARRATNDEEPRDPARHGGHERRRRRSTSPRFGSSKVGVFDTSAARGRHLRARRAANQIARERRRPERARARRGARPALRAHALRQRDLGRRHRDRQRDRARAALQPRAARASSNGRPFLYDAALTSSNGEAVVRELPHLRRLRQPRLGPRQSRRRRARTTRTRSALGRSATPTSTR